MQTDISSHSMYISCSVLLSWNDGVEFCPESDVECLHRTGDSRGVEEGQCGGEGVAVGNQ